MTTLSDIAKRCGVTKQTVSQVLRNPDHAAYLPATRTRILRAARDMNYVPNRMASALNRGGTKMLSLILPWNIGNLVDAAQRSAEALGCGLMIQFTAEPTLEADLRAVRAALEWRVDGLIWFPSWPGSSYGSLFDEIRGMGTRLVLLEGRLPECPEADAVEFDYAGGYRAAIDHLVEQGYRRLVYVTPWPLRSRRAHPGHWTELWRERWKLLRKAASGRALKTGTAAEEPAAKLNAAVAEYLEQPEGPVCFLCENVERALRLAEAVDRCGMRVPEDAGIVTYDDLPVVGGHWLAELVSPSMSSLIRPFEAMGRQAVERLLDPQPRGADEPATPSELLALTLVCRESTARAGRVRKRSKA